MERPKPLPQELYTHFKGKLYQIITIATHSKTMEEMVVYQALYGDYKVYVRSLSMFMSEVDRRKYPDAKQRYRFERVDTAGSMNNSVITQGRDLNRDFADKKQEINTYDVSAIKSKMRIENVSAADRRAVAKEQFEKEPYKPSKVMEKSIDDEAQELNLDPLVIQFMDADLASEKNDILSKLRPTITNEMIDIMALSLGVVVNEGDVYDRFNDLRTCLSTIEKFESTRLRS